MFGLKKDKEKIEDLEKDLENSLQRNNILEHQLKRLKESAWSVKENTKNAVQALSAGQDKMDECLTEVVSIVKNKESGQLDYSISQIDSVTEQIKEAYQSVRETEKQIAVKLQKQKDITEKLKKELTKIEGPKKDLQEQMQRSTSESTQMQANMKKLQETAKMMSSLSLNAAIEAGRLGEKGKEFLAAAEDVRKQTEEYQQGLGILQQEIQGMERRIHKMEGSLQAMEDIMKENQGMISQLAETTVVSEVSEMVKQMTEETQCKKLQVVSVGLQKWNQFNADEKQAILDKMEEIGTIFLEEQKNRNEIEKQINTITEQEERSRENE